MKKHWFASLVFLAAMVGGSLVAVARAQELDPMATVENTPTMDATVAPQPTASPTPLSPVTAALEVAAVEPRVMVNNVGGTLSVYGAGFTNDSAVRLIGCGLLTASYVNPTALTAQVPIGLLAGTYDVEVSDGVERATLRAGLTVLAPTPTPGRSHRRLHRRQDGPY